jgi:cytochrome c oxidase cbb3-type subunit 3
VAEKKQIDSVTGVEMTGHEWDGIRELDMPLPRWWLWTFYVTIVWSIGYWVAMPSWPLISDYARGLLGYSQRATVAAEIADAKAAQAQYLDRIAASDPATIRNTPALLEFALAGGRSAFAVNCVQCHGSGGAGAPGYPNLNDDDWLWGGSLDAIQTTLRHGIRSADPDTRLNDMPAFVRDGLLDRAQANDAVEYVLQLSGEDHDAAGAMRGKTVFAEQCVSCHGPAGKGMRDLGSPDLTDAIWLYGGNRQALQQTVLNGRKGVMPAWQGILDPQTLKMLTVYVHSLGGGE